MHSAILDMHIRSQNHMRDVTTGDQITLYVEQFSGHFDVKSYVYTTVYLIILKMM
jgi:hypothetical protein